MITRQDFPDLEDHPVCLNAETMSKKEILHKFPNELRHMIAELMMDGKIGNCTGSVQITSIYNFQKDNKDQAYYADSFTLCIPFAGQSIYWEIMFCHRDLLMAPDIMFDDDSFLCGPQLLNTIKNNVPALNIWHPYNSEALVTLIKEYFTLYKKHNLQTLSKEEYSRFNFEYTSLVGETIVEKDNVEVLVEYSGVVHFLIRIPIDFSPLQSYIIDNESESENPGYDLATLLITFHRLDGSKIQPFLYLSPHFEQVLGHSGSKGVPPFDSQCCLMDYIPEVKKMITERIEAIVMNHQMKIEYITYLVTMYSCSVMEYDASTFSKITMLFENKNFYWLLIINLGNKFPQEKPKIILRSIYHMINTRPYTEQITDYPYSPRWDPVEMAKRALTHIFANIGSFQNASTQKSQSF